MERLGPQPVGPHARVLAAVILLDDAGPPQHAQVPAHHRRADAERLGQLARPPGAAAQDVDGPAPRRVGERDERPVELGGRAHEAVLGLRSRWQNHQW